MPATKDAFEDVLVAPIGSMIRQVGESVAEAQRSLAEAYLSLHASRSQALIDIGFTPSWYELSQIEVELKLAIHVEQEHKPGKKPGLKLFAASHNAQYQNAFNFKADGASTVKLRLTPAPPPVALAAGEEG